MKSLTRALIALLCLAAAHAEQADPPFMSAGEHYMIKFSDGASETVEIVKRKGDTDWYLVKQNSIIQHDFYINIGQAISVTYLSKKKAEPTPTPANK